MLMLIIWSHNGAADHILQMTGQYAWKCFFISFAKKYSKNIVELRHTNKQATVLTVTFYTKGLHDIRQNK